MAITSKTIKTTTGTTITIYNGNTVMQESIYDSKFKLQSTITYTGTTKTTTKYSYDSSGRIIETKVYNDLNQLTGINKYNYNGKLLDTINHYDANNNLKSTDFYVNGKFDHSGINSTQTGDWSNITGHGSIDVLKALSDILDKPIADVSSNVDWALKSAHFDDAWAAGYTGKGIVIANIDTGIDLKNLDLTKNISKFSWNFVANNSNVQDDNGHGSFTAGIMIADNNSDKITGGAYDAEIMVLKALNQYGNGTADNIAKAIIYAVDNGADIINMSLNSKLAQPMIKTAMEYAAKHDVLLAVSSGNSLSSTPNYPAVYATSNDNVCAVGASFDLKGADVFNAVSSKAGSNTAYNYVVAGGTAISGYDHKGITTMSGTSMAAPLVASEMAILKQCLESFGTYTNNLIDDMVMDYVVENTHDVRIVGVQAIAGVDNLLV
jgi:subtilisin